MGSLPHLPAGIEMWPPLWQAASLFLLTFLLEDVAAVGGGLLLATGNLAWPWAFGSCFLGIWTGDALLYLLARVLGRTGFERTSLRRFSRRVEQSEHWFARRGDIILIFSRLMPGARLPTYLAAGFLRLPLRRFLFVTGVASVVWTLVVLLATKAIGSQVLTLLGSWRWTGWVLVATILVSWAVIYAARRLVGGGNLFHLAVRLQRLKHWEFWPPWMFYPPVGLYCLWLAIKYRGLTLPTAANPGIFSGGFVGESKMATLRSLMEGSPEFTAEAELLRGSTPQERLGALRELCSRRGVDYPFILKPDVGQRGVGVKLIQNEEQALAYLRSTEAPLLVQRFAPGPNEAGIFYYRFPHEPAGHILAITDKVFPFVIGDGRSTVSELVWADPRARFLAAKYLARLHDRRDEVLPAGATLKLVEAGNHAQGCVFRDGTHLSTPALEARIEAISRKVPGFFIGRYDVRYQDLTDLQAGRNFQIVELNGAASEVTSIYDARNSIFTAYRTLFRQWDLVFSIGAANRRHGRKPTSLVLMWRKWREYSRYAATYPVAD